MTNRLTTAFFALLLSLGAVAGEVNLYTDRQESFMRPIIAAFEQSSGDKVSVLFTQSGPLWQRLQVEGASSPADVVLFKDRHVLESYARAGFAQAISDPLLLTLIPPAYRGAENRWLAVTKRARVIFTPVAEPLDSYAALAAPAQQGGVCLRPPTHVYNIELFADLLGRMGKDKFRAWLQGLKNNLARPPQGKDRTQIQGVLNGECRAAIANSYYYFNLIARADDEMAQRLREQVRMNVPAQPHINITGMALAKHAPHTDAALRFMRFLASDEGQQIFAKQNYEFPARDDAPYPAELEPYRHTVQNAEPWSYHNGDILRRQASQIVEEIGF